MGGHLRRRCWPGNYLYRHEKTICPPGRVVCRLPETSFRQPYYVILPELMLDGYALSVGLIAPSARLRRSFIGLEGPSALLTLDGPNPEASEDLP